MRKIKLQQWKKLNALLILYDILAINAAYFFALLLRFDFLYTTIKPEYLKTFLYLSPIYTVFSIVVFYLLKMYKVIWQFASITDISICILSTLITAPFYTLMSSLVFYGFPVSSYVIGAIIQLFLITIVRISYRFFLTIKRESEKKKIDSLSQNVLIIGAGEAGRTIVHDIYNKKEIQYSIKGFIDDDANKIGRYIENIPILGDRHDIFKVVRVYKINTIILAIPSASIKERQEMLSICKDTGAKLKILPSIRELIDEDNVSISQLKDVQIEDLLERDVIKINNDETLQYIKDKVVLVTGGGGTIGSELCRQIARQNPKLLIIFDIYENTTYELELELKRKYPNLNFITLIGSVRERLRVDNIFQQYKPQIVYHAAAHKHVPLMEGSPNEAIKNNVFGTYNIAFASLKYKVEKFILISTDKAVNPTSIMGTTKRVCEMIMQSMSKVSKSKDPSLLPKIYQMSDFEEITDCNFVTDFVAVRFGNVLGSNGSVIPIFEQQIKEGGPVTITHKEIVRYFMTIYEAVGLVIEAGAYAKGGEIFILDMGQPVKIDTLARNLIKLSGLKPDIDIEIKYTGLRPGEKLYEEKLMDEEGLTKTPNKLIHIAKPINFDVSELFNKLKEMRTYSKVNNATEVVKLLNQIVPTFHSSEDDIKNNKEKFEKFYNSSK